MPISTSPRASRAMSPSATVSAYNAEIAAQAKADNGSAKRAALLLHELLGLGLKPEVHTFTAVLNAVAKRPDGTAELAYAILQKMTPFCKPNQIHFNATLNACANQRPAAIGIASKVLDESLAAGFRPTSYSLSALLRAAAFAEGGPRRDLARSWFTAHATPAAINNHVVRALRRAVGDYEADELIAAVQRSRAQKNLANELERFGLAAIGLDTVPTPPQKLSPRSSPRHSSISPAPSSPSSSPRQSAEGPFAYQSRYSTTGWGSPERGSSARQATESDWRSKGGPSAPISMRFSEPRTAGTSTSTSAQHSEAGQPPRTSLFSGTSRKSSLLATPSLANAAAESSPGEKLGLGALVGRQSVAASVVQSTSSSSKGLESRQSFNSFGNRQSCDSNNLTYGRSIPFPSATTSSGSTTFTTSTTATKAPRKSSVTLLSPMFFSTPQCSSSPAETTSPYRPSTLERRRSSFFSPILRQPMGPANSGRGMFRASMITAH